nr:tripartite tricarboxylate transporter substrate-binding protein [Bradyrhizobium cytisi]
MRLLREASGGQGFLSQAGKIRLLAVTPDKRSSGAPDIPTAIESGMPDLQSLQG